MKPEQKELIEKMSAWKNNPISEAIGRGQATGNAAERIAKKYNLTKKDVLKDRGGLRDVARADARKVAPARFDKKSEMREIIDDIIKGAKDNGFGRPVNIQTSWDAPDWTPLDTAKCAGMLIALDEQGYTMKEASEFLGLPEEHLQAVIKAVG